MSTHGARKGLADTALKTADAGYLTENSVMSPWTVSLFKMMTVGVMRVVKKAIMEGDNEIVPLREKNHR